MNRKWSVKKEFVKKRLTENCFKWDNFRKDVGLGKRF